MRDPAHILVVDDTPANAKLLKDILEVSGYSVVTAADGREALDCLGREEFDLVLLDVVMPRMNGYEVCRTIRQDRATELLPVVLVTALGPDEERLKGIEAGADDFLTKPIRQQELLARVSSLLRIKQLHDAVARQTIELRELNETLERRVEEQVVELERLGRLRRFIAPHLASIIGAEDGDRLLESHRREVTLMFAELEGFAGFAESAEPEEIIDVLREFQRQMGGLVMEHEGTLERCAGHSMMVFFNDPIEIPDHRQRAVRLALDMRQRFTSLETEWRRLGYRLGLRMGLDSGYATLGLVGFEKRWDYAAVGSVTTRAEGLCYNAGPGQILVSRPLAAKVEDLVDVEAVGEITLAGSGRPVSVFNVVGLRGESERGPSPLERFDLIGECLGHHRVLEKIGEGGMGAVYLAEDTKLNRKVALKVLRMGARRGSGSSPEIPEQVARLEREARAIALLNHPNIVTVYSVERERGLNYLTMEFVEGRPLSQEIPEGGLAMEKFFDIAVPLAGALSAAHDRGIVHRDLKPANIMISAEGRVKVLDFGIAKLREDSSDAGTLTQDDSILGTLQYMSPEQLEGRHADHLSDIFSFGIILHEMATGERPFKGRTAAGLAAALLQGEFSVDRKHGLPERLCGLLGRCLERRPERRFPTVRELHRELIHLGEELGCRRTSG